MGGSAAQARAAVRRLTSGRSAPLVLELDLTNDPAEGVPTDPVSAALAHRRPTLRGILDGLRRARHDERVAGVLTRVASCGMPLARAEEIRDAVAAFRGGSHRFAIAFAETFGEFGGGTVPYYLACAFEEIWLAPPGDLGLTGVALETPFVRDTLDRLGIEMDVGARYEYKNALNTFVERDFTPAHLEATKRIVESCSDVIVAGLATGRGLPEARVRELIDSGPLSSAEALAAGLVDRLGYRDEVYEAAKTRAGAPGTPARLMYLDAYRKAAERADALPLRNLAPVSDLLPGLAGGGGHAAERLVSAFVGRTRDGRAGHAGHAGDNGHGGHGGHDGAEPAIVPGSSEFPEQAEFPEQTEATEQAEATDGGTGRSRSGHAEHEHYDHEHYEHDAAEPAATAPASTWWGRDRGQSRKVVAVIHGTGPVVHGRGGSTLLSGVVLASDAVSAAFRAAARDDDVAAAVFRVDSPGGSYVGSDVVRREVERFQASGRPVVVSMGSVAGSGGYFVALSADVIVASAGTLTGSIGVLGGKQVFRGLLDKAGIRFGAVAEGENALMMSPSRPFTATERDKLDRFLDRVYEDFVGKVAAARGMTRDEVHEVARGRVWTGADAHSCGLVDEIGGFEHAVELAWARAGLPPEQTPRTRLFPKLSLVERALPSRSSEDRAAADLRTVFRTGRSSPAGRGMPGAWGASGGRGASGGWGALSAIAASLGLPPAGPLLMPPIGQIT